MAEQTVDVFISGAGPSGLVLAHSLTQLGHSVFIVDAADKGNPDFPMYGRACTLFPRTSEILEQFGLLQDMSKMGVFPRGSTAYSKGARVDRAFNTTPATGTFIKRPMNLRLKYSEDVFRRRLADADVKVQAPVKLQSFTIGPESDEYPVSAVCKNTDNATFTVRSKYIVGTDGGSSTVRKEADIPFVGARHSTEWVRIDGIIKTNIPNHRSEIVSIESETHGHVLFAPLDHGATRVGYVLDPALFEKYGRNMTAQDAAREAQAAVAPFELEFEKIDWHTVYGIQQHVAARYFDKRRILLAGDAAHTHSSATAQGMNTGMHDVASLAWRLSGVLHGWYGEEVLSNYSDERQGVAEQLIENDKVISALMSRIKPEIYKNRPEDPFTLLNEFMMMGKTAAFTSGMGISYPANLLNEHSNEDKQVSKAVVPGHRAPDTLVQKLGITGPKTRLFELTSYNGKFRVFLFTGRISATKTALQGLLKQLSDSVAPYAHVLDVFTIADGDEVAIEEYLGAQLTTGRGLWDPDHSAHQAYGVSLDAGGIVVVRPDGIVGLVTALQHWNRVEAYFSRIAHPRDVTAQAEADMKRLHLGEFMGANESTLPAKSRRA